MALQSLSYAIFYLICKYLSLFFGWGLGSWLASIIDIDRPTSDTFVRRRSSAIKHGVCVLQFTSHALKPEIKNSSKTRHWPDIGKDRPQKGRLRLSIPTSLLPRNWTRSTTERSSWKAPIPPPCSSLNMKQWIDKMNVFQYWSYECVLVPCGYRTMAKSIFYPTVASRCIFAPSAHKSRASDNAARERPWLSATSL